MNLNRDTRAEDAEMIAMMEKALATAREQDKRHEAEVQRQMRQRFDRQNHGWNSQKL